ncbi:hypothetical protein [Sphaerothrix gracilis]|uniref:hypothetical protein n=1 Tax=Sphaerothrix gracilis TaxID=3151835 RepID=UPI0031FC0138
MRGSAIALLGLAALTACRQNETTASWTWDTDLSSDRQSDLTFGQDLLAIKTASQLTPPQVELSSELARLSRSDVDLTATAIPTQASTQASSSPKLSLVAVRSAASLPPIPIRPDLAPPAISTAPITSVSVAPASPAAAVTATAAPAPPSAGMLPDLSNLLLTATPPGLLPVEPEPVSNAPQFTRASRARTVAAVVDSVMVETADSPVTTATAMPEVAVPLPEAEMSAAGESTAAADPADAVAEPSDRPSASQLPAVEVEAAAVSQKTPANSLHKPLQLDYSETLRLSSASAEPTCPVETATPNAEAMPATEEVPTAASAPAQNCATEVSILAQTPETAALDTNELAAAELALP